MAAAQISATLFPVYPVDDFHAAFSGKTAASSRKTPSIPLLYLALWFLSFFIFVYRVDDGHVPIVPRSACGRQLDARLHALIGLKIIFMAVVSTLLCSMILWRSSLPQ